MESRITQEEQVLVDEGQLVLFGISFSEEYGTQLRRRTDQPELFEIEDGRTVYVDPVKRAEELESMRGAGVTGV